MTIRKITEEEIRAHWVQRLSDTPNRAGRFGAAGMTAAEMKAAFDALPLLIAERLNELVAIIEEGRLAELIPSPEGKSLAELLRGITSGELASLLTVDGTRTLTALAAALDTHDHGNSYASLDESGRIPTALLPIGYDPRFEEAERERAEAEKRREAVVQALSEAFAALEEAEHERDRRESEREARLGRCEETLATSAVLAEAAYRRSVALSREVENIAAATEGTTHTFYEDGSIAYEKRPPAKVLPYARILSIGGGKDGKRTATRAVTSHGKSLLPFPYPAFSANRLPSGFTAVMNEDGSITFDGTVDKNISFLLYRETDDLALPAEEIYIDGLYRDGLILYVKTGASGLVYKNGLFTPDPSDEYYGRYLIYLNIAKGSSFRNYRVVPSITRGSTPRKGALYRPPVRLEIPDAVRALPGYGMEGNALNLEAGYYLQTVDHLGNPLAEPIRTPLPPELGDNAFLPVEEDGLLVFENDGAAEVASTVLYGIRLM